MRTQRERSRFAETLAERRQREHEELMRMVRASEAEQRAEQRAGAKAGGNSGGQAEGGISNRTAAAEGPGSSARAGAGGSSHAEQVAALRQSRQKALDAMDADRRVKMGTRWTEKALEAMTERDWRILREDFQIRASGKNVPRPLRDWTEAPLDRRLHDAITKANYTEPSAIQRQAVPIGLQQRDIIGLAETGSGKTAAFLLPLLQYIMCMPTAARQQCNTDGPLALILAPVRELAQQIDQECRKLAEFTGVRSVAVVGGEGQDLRSQGMRLSRENFEVVVATPGRLQELLKASQLVFNQCRYVILDEADQMIGLGFLPIVEEIMNTMPPSDAKAAAAAVENPVPLSGPSVDAERGVTSFSDAKRTTIMFSATMPPGVERLARRFMTQPVTVRIGDQDSMKNKRISQDVIYVKQSQKRQQLRTVLSKCERPAIVFVNNQGNADQVAGYVEQDVGSAVVVWRGGMGQTEREAALQAFKAGEADVLVATDVAGRGIDATVNHVINYDLPGDIEKYTHRIGRTGRAGKEGASTSFFTDQDERVLYDLKKYLIATDNKVPRTLETHPAAQSKGGDGGHAAIIR